MKIAGFVCCLYLLGWATGMGCAEHPKPALNVENAAAVAQYDAALVECKAKARAAKSMAVYDDCEAGVVAHICRESPTLRKAWFRCEEVADVAR